MFLAIIYNILSCKPTQEYYRTECSSLFHLNNTFFLSLYSSEKPDNPRVLQHHLFSVCKPFRSDHISDYAKNIGKIRLFSIIFLLFWYVYILISTNLLGITERI